jgi:hypothetical protein
MLLAAVLPNGGITILLSSLHNLYLMTYAGFFVNLSKIPPVLRWLRWFNCLGYALEVSRAAAQKQNHLKGASLPHLLALLTLESVLTATAIVTLSVNF